MQSCDVDGYRERSLVVLCIYNVKREWKSKLVSPDISQWHIRTVCAAECIKSCCFSQMAAEFDADSRLSCLADVHTHLSHCHSGTAHVFQLFAIWAVCCVKCWHVSHSFCSLKVLLEFSEELSHKLTDSSMDITQTERQQQHLPSLMGLNRMRN